MSTPDILKRLKRLRRKWLCVRNQEYKFQNGDISPLSREKSVGIAIGYGMCIGELEDGG